MHQFLPKQYNGEDINYSILDVRNSKLITVTGFHDNTLAALEGETSYIESVWPNL